MAGTSDKGAAKVLGPERKITLAPIRESSRDDDRRRDCRDLMPVMRKKWKRGEFEGFDTPPELVETSTLAGEFNGPNQNGAFSASRTHNGDRSSQTQSFSNHCIEIQCRRKPMYCEIVCQLTQTSERDHTRTSALTSIEIRIGFRIS